MQINTKLIFLSNRPHHDSCSFLKKGTRNRKDV